MDFDKTIALEFFEEEEEEKWNYEYLNSSLKDVILGKIPNYKS